MLVKESDLLFSLRLTIVSPVILAKLVIQFPPFLLGFRFLPHGGDDPHLREGRPFRGDDQKVRTVGEKARYMAGIGLSRLECGDVEHKMSTKGKCKLF